MAKRMLQALRKEAVDRPPFWFMRQAGRYLPEYRDVRASAENFLDFCYTPEKALEVTLQPLRRYRMDAAILFSDILVIPHALGQGVRFVQGEGPVLDAITDGAGIDGLSNERMDEVLAPVFDVVGQIRAALDDDTALIGFAGAPWTVALYMVEGRSGTDGASVRTWAARDADGFQRLIDLLIATTVRYLDRQVQAGAEVLQLFDSWAGLLDEDGFRRWVIEPNRLIVDAIKRLHPDVPIIGFPRNAGVLYEAFARDTGVDALSIDHTVPAAWAAEHLQPHVTVQGNLDNHLLLAGGAAMEHAVTRILDTLGHGPFVFNLGHGIVPATPPENVGRVADMVRAWRAR